MSFSALETWNQTAFLAMNAGLRPSPLAVGIAKVLATGAVYLVMAALGIGWVRRGKCLRYTLLDATLAALFSLAIAVGITLIWYHPRPFEIGLGRQMIPHVTDASFPSDHGTLLFVLAISLMVSAQWLWSIGFLALALSVAWGRIYLGVHFPLDMVGAMLVAAVGNALVHLGKPLLHSRLYPILNAVYEGLLRQLRLPKRMFPRDL